jgi:hypothetical protein
MASLVIKSDGFENQVIELRLGVNKFGRGPANDFQIEHPTISVHHCDIILSEEGVVLRDCNSTNGTFAGGKRIDQTELQAGDELRLGDVAMVVKNTDFRIAIPKFDIPRPAPPVVLTDGGLICPRHPRARVTHQCTYCREVLCDACVTRLRRRGGKVLKLCPLCSHGVEVLGGEKKKKKGLFGFLQKTVKMPFIPGTKRRG